jgi:hypothetical protein
MPAVPGSAVSAYNNEPGTGRTGYWEIPPNNYDFYTEEEKYKPVVQADGGILSSASNPSPLLDPHSHHHCMHEGRLAAGGQTPSFSPMHACGFTAPFGSHHGACARGSTLLGRRECWGVRRPRMRRGGARWMARDGRVMPYPAGRGAASPRRGVNQPCRQSPRLQVLSPRGVSHDNWKPPTI